MQEFQNNLDNNNWYFIFFPASICYADVPMQMWAAVKLVYPIQQTSAGLEALMFLWQL